MKAYNDMEILGQTIDDAAGEAIDKCSGQWVWVIGGPIIDKLARQAILKRLLSANLIFRGWITASAD